MTRLTPKASGFTLIELLVVIALVGILSGLSIASFSQRWAQERLLRATKETQSWLEEQRKIAMKEGQACEITINTTDAILDPTSTTLTLDDGSQLKNSCSNQAILSIRNTVTNGNGINLSTADPGVTSLRFSFRGLSEIITSSTNEQDTKVLTLKLNHPESNKQRCIRIMSPLGLIRTGWSSATSNTCHYSDSF